MQAHTLAPKTARITTPRVGRGGKRGKTSGRGTKGQNARAGHKKRPEMRDIIKKLPKRRGHGKNRARTVRAKRHEYEPINLATLEAAFVAGDAVNPEILYKKGLIAARGGKLSYVKILGSGSITKKLVISNCSASTIAKNAIEAAGGSILS